MPTAGLVEGLRVVKDEEELELIRQATRIADSALARLVDQGFRGATEAETAWQLEDWMREMGADGASFDIIVAGGAHGALPHAVPRPEPIPADTLVVVDMGARHAGYASDCTRTLATGTLPPALEEAYAVCLEAQRVALVRALAIEPEVLRATGRTRPCPKRAGSSPRRGSGSTSATASGMGWGSTSTSAHGSARRAGRCFKPAWL